MICIGRKIGYRSTLLLLGTTFFVLVQYFGDLINFVIKRPSLAQDVEDKRFKLDRMTDEELTADASIPAVITVVATGNFSERVHQFNVQLSDIRRRTWQSRGTGEWRDQVHFESVEVLWGARDDYLDLLAAKYPHVITVILPWLSTGKSVMHTANIPLQTYYEWTADNTLCTLIENPGLTMAKYDVIFNRTCVRNINATASPRTLQPLFLNARPLRHTEMNSERALPAHFYTTPPPFIVYAHLHRDAIVTVNGDVYSGNLKLVLDACSDDTAVEVPDVDRMPVYDEVLIIAQYWGTSVFHRMAEIMPRVVLFCEFLRDNPEVRILAPEPSGGRLSELLRIIGVDDMRLVIGPVRAKVVYQPRSSKCGFANLQESQTLSFRYHKYISKTFPPRPRNKLLLIRRTTSRRFAEQKRIEEVLERAATDYNLTYTMFTDNPTPSLNDTMMMFDSAVMIVAPAGAAESNMYFSQPGTYVVEGVCNVPHVNLCFQRLAYILGHHWHGVTSRGGCETVVDVSASSIEDAVRSHLCLWQRACSP